MNEESKTIRTKHGFRIDRRQPGCFSRTRLGGCPMSREEAERFNQIRELCRRDIYLPKGYRTKRVRSRLGIKRKGAPNQQQQEGVKKFVYYQSGIRLSLENFNGSIPITEVKRMRHNCVAVAPDGRIIAAGGNLKKLASLQIVERRHASVMAVEQYEQLSI